MEYEVFKVVRAYHGKLTSIYMTGPAQLEYTLGEKVVSTTPIFVYTGIKEAHKLAQTSNFFRLLRGTTTTEPIQIANMSFDILDVAYPWNKNQIENFWLQVEQDRWSIRELYTRNMPSEDSAYGVYDFTPLEDMPFFMPL